MHAGRVRKRNDWHRWLPAAAQQPQQQPQPTSPYAAEQPAAAPALQQQRSPVSPNGHHANNSKRANAPAGERSSHKSSGGGSHKASHDATPPSSSEVHTPKVIGHTAPAP